MAFAFVQRVGLLVADVSAERLVRGCHFILDHLHVRPNHDLALGPTGGDHPEDGRSVEDSQRAYVDVFEHPCFVSTEYKDDRAAVNLANIACHAITLAHAKSCECKACRDRRHAFPNHGTGRRYGYRGTPIRTRTAAVDLASLFKSVSSERKSKKSVANTRASAPCRGAPLQKSRLRGGDLKILKAGSNRFAVLDVEKTQDEDDYEQDVEEHHDNELAETASNYSALLPVAIPSLHPGESSASHPLAQLVAAFNSQTDRDADDNDLDHSGSNDDPATGPLPATAHLKSTAGPAGRVSERARPGTLDLYQGNPFHPATAIDRGSNATDIDSKEMPWEEDDWAQRMVPGVGLLSWTRTRLLLRYKQGEEDVEYFVGTEML